MRNSISLSKLYKKSSFDIFDPMKNILRITFFRRLLYVLAAIVLFLLLLNNIIMPWYVSSPERTVPRVIGIAESDAVLRLKELDLEPVIADTTFDEKFPVGSVIYQKPAAGEVVKEGRRIYLFISGGEPVVSVPMLKGKSVRDAKFTLERIGLKLGKIDSVLSNNPKDMIFDQQFVASTPLKKGDSVGVSISMGVGGGYIVVPNLIGQSLTNAQKVLADSSLKIGKINYQPSISVLPNTVLDQYPSKGTKLNPGDAVDIFVTKAVDSKIDEKNIEE